MIKELDISLFMEHNGRDFPLEQIISFMNDKDVCYREWSSSMQCDYCEGYGLEYFREEEVYYNKTKGFYLSFDDVEDDDVDFAIYRCPKCGKWFTYID